MVFALILNAISVRQCLINVSKCQVATIKISAALSILYIMQ